MLGSKVDMLISNEKNEPKNCACKYFQIDNVPSAIKAKCDACFTYPCANGASCEALPNRDYQCNCAPGYHGRHCEQVIDACYGQPCINAGTCRVMEEGRFRLGVLIK